MFSHLDQKHNSKQRCLGKQVLQLKKYIYIYIIYNMTFFEKIRCIIDGANIVLLQYGMSIMSLGFHRHLLNNVRQ